MDDGGRFLDERGREAAELGWRPGELFDVTAGLVWRLAGQRVVYIGADRVHLLDSRVILRMETRDADRILGAQHGREHDASAASFGA